MATIGAIIPNTRFALAVTALPVPLCLVSKISGVYAYKTAYITLLTKLYAQFQPNNAEEECAVVVQKRKMPVRTVERASVPRRPREGISTNRPPRRQPGMPSAAMMRELR
jgi:hypothetical protein